MVAGADVWGINSGESVAFEYSRTNYNVSDFYEPNMFRASDHDPEIVGLNAELAKPPVTLNLLGINDFHGRIDTNTVKFAGTVEQLTDAGRRRTTRCSSARVTSSAPRCSRRRWTATSRPSTS